MATIKDNSAPRAHPSTRKARTNSGMFGSLERHYFAGDLTDQGEERFEALIYALRSLYKVAV